MIISNENFVEQNFWPQKPFLLNFIHFIFSATSILAGIIIFSTLGHISVLTGQELNQLSTQGLELIFVSYPQALSSMQPSAMWSILFFSSLFLLGIDSVFASVEVVLSTIMDSIRSKKIKREMMAGLVCFTLFLATIPNCFQGGIFFYKLLDWYTCVQSLAIIGTLEVIVVLWIYGAKNLR